MKVVQMREIFSNLVLLVILHVRRNHDVLLYFIYFTCIQCWNSNDLIKQNLFFSCLLPTCLQEPDMLMWVYYKPANIL